METLNILWFSMNSIMGETPVPLCDPPISRAGNPYGPSATEEKSTDPRSS